MLASCQLFCHFEHETTVENDPQRRRRSEGNLLLVVSKWNNVNSGNAAGFLEYVRDVVDKVFARVSSLRAAGKMHANADSTTTCHPPQRNGRIDSARKQRHHLPRTAHRQPAHAPYRPSVDVRSVLHNLDDHRDVGVFHLHALFGKRTAEVGTDYLIHLHGIGLEIGVIAARMHLERLEFLAFGKGFYGNLAHLDKISFALEAAGDACNTRHAFNSVGDFDSCLAIAPFTQEHAQPASYAVNGDDRKINEKRLNILEQALLESGTIMAFQANLVIMDQADTLMLELHGFVVNGS